MPQPSRDERPQFRRRASAAIVAAIVGASFLLPTGGAAASTTAAATTTVTTTTTVVAPYLSVEQYYLKLLNCTRTGGWVRTDGTCAGYGSGRYSTYVKPLVLSTGISNKVSRPYAVKLARQNACSHFLDGDPGYRLRRAGYRSWTWGENIGCRNGYTNLKRAVLATHLNFQSEKSTGGGHWKNMKNPKYTVVGIGVGYYASSRVRLVTDFYRP